MQVVSSISAKPELPPCRPVRSVSARFPFYSRAVLKTVLYTIFTAEHSHVEKILNSVLTRQILRVIMVSKLGDIRLHIFTETVYTEYSKQSSLSGFRNKFLDTLFLNQISRLISCE